MLRSSARDLGPLIYVQVLIALSIFKPPMGTKLITECLDTLVQNLMISNAYEICVRSDQCTHDVDSLWLGSTVIELRLRTKED